MSLLLPSFTQHKRAKDWVRKHLIIDLPNQVSVDVTLLIGHLKKQKGKKLKGGLASARRSAIRYYFDEIFGSPDEDAEDLVRVSRCVLCEPLLSHCVASLCSNLC